MAGSSGPAWPGLLVMGVVGVGIAGAAYASYQAEKRRNGALEVVARTMGFAYQEKPDTAALQTWADLPLLNAGHSRTPRRLMTGRLADRDAAIVDYRYLTGSGKSVHTHVQTVALFHDSTANLPAFRLAPENVLHGLAEFFGAQDIDFEQNEAFSKAYLLKGPDEAAIRRVFTTDALAFFAGAPGWCVQAHGGRLIAYRGEKYVEPDQIPAFAADALRIAGLFRT